MANEILDKYKTAVEPTISLASIANNAGRICALVDNSATRAGRILLGIKVKLGTTPVAGNTVRVYLIRQTTAGTVVKGGGGALGDADAGVSAEPLDAPVVASFYVDGTANKSFSEVVEVVSPGPKFSFVVWNSSGDALNATPDSPAIQVIPVVDEVQ